MESTNKRKEQPTPFSATEEEDILKITPLGAGNEVGRSCILVEFKGKKILLDCGLHPAFTGLSALPFFDHIDDLSTIDLILITHFHVDHAAALPYLMEKTTFKGRVFMTHPTRAIYKWLLSDYVKISSLSPEDQLYNEKDLQKSYERIEVIDFHQEITVDGIKFTPYNAGHVLGAAMFLIEIAGVRMLYTGDYSREEDRHLMAAERPLNVIPEVLICESTYGVQSHEPRPERESRFTRMVHTIVKRGGRCLLPVFALGRAQELLLILDEYWTSHPELHNVPIYYASALAKKCMTVYQTYTNMMNAKIREQAKQSNPFQFKHISNLKSISSFDDVGPCVMMASPGMLQSGLSRELLELWCVDKKNGVIIPGYVVEGTLGKQILSQPTEIVALNGSKLPLRLTVEYISFSAHVDFKENSEFIDQVASKNLVLVHGDSNEMGRLRSALTSRYLERDIPITIYTPRNTETVELHFRGEKTAKIIGSLAKDELVEGTIVQGILALKDFSFSIIAAKELDEFTDLVTTNIVQKQSVRTRAPLGIIKWHLEQMFGPLQTREDNSYFIFNAVSLSVGKIGPPQITLTWDSTPVNDMIADSILTVVLQAEISPASVKATRSECKHEHGATNDDLHEASKAEVKAEVKHEKPANDDNHAHEPNEFEGGPNEDGKEDEQNSSDEKLKTTPTVAEMVTQQLILTFGEEFVVHNDGRWLVEVDEEKVELIYDESGKWDVISASDRLVRRVETLMARVVNTCLDLNVCWGL